MSHYTTVKTEIRDLDALHEACSELGVELRSGEHCRGFAGATRQAHRIIQLKGPYDVAVDPSSDGGRYELTTDWWGGHVEREVGVGFGRLLQSYGVHKVLREARVRGLRATRTNDNDGFVLVTLEGGSL